MKRVQLLSLFVLLVAAFVGLVYALDPPHNFTNTIDCTDCHTPHNAPGGAITITAGNANLCQSCHVSGGMAANKPLPEADQALPSPGLPSGTNPSGTSHRWDSGASGHVAATGTNTSTGKVQSAGVFTGRYAKTYTISITTQGDTGTARFNWTAVRWPGDTGGGSGTDVLTGASIALNEGITATFTNGTSPSFKLNDSWKIYVRTDINQPTTTALSARISDGKIMCSTCHNQHSQAAQPFDPNAPIYGGSGTGAGRHFQRIDNNTAQMCNDCHSARNVGSSSQGSHPVGIHPSDANACNNCHGGGGSPIPLGTGGYVGCITCHQPHYSPATDGTLLRLTSTTTLCTTCHANSDTASGLHFNTSTGVLWPGGQYGSTFPQITDTSKRGACINCHQPHGWPDAAAPSQDYAKLLVESTGNLCFTCHDSNGPSTKNVYDKFNPSPNYSATGASGAPIDQVHDSSLCSKCHNPHVVTASGKNTDPDTGVAYTQTYSKLASYTRDGFNNTYYSATTNLDPTNPAGAQNSPAGWQIGVPTCTTTCGSDHAAASQGTYSGSQAVTFTMRVSTGGGSGTAKFTCTSSPATGVCSNYAANAYTWTDNAWITIGLGVQFKVDDTQGSASLTLNETWTIAVTWNPGQTTCAPNCVEPDFVTFCLTCHDGTTPAGVTMPANMVNIAAEYFSRDQHGSIAGNTGSQISKGYKKMPWTTLAQFNAGQEPANPYAAHQCVLCHDGHGSGNIFHLKDSINVAGIQLKIGGEGQCANGTSCGPWTVANGFTKSGNTTYKLPCTGGNNNPDCSQNPSGSQALLKWGAWCTFCHTQSAHTGVDETTSCNTGHVHGGGNF